MRKKAGFFTFLLLLLSACGTAGVTEPIVEAPETSTPVITLLPTLTLQPQSPSQSPFCQGEPEYIQLGSSTNISVFALPPSQAFAVYLDSKLVATGSTNLDGYASINIAIPADGSIGSHQVSIYALGTPIVVTCQIEFWSDLIPSPTFYPAPTLTPKPTLSPPQLTMTATQQTLQERMGKHCWGGSAWNVRVSPNGEWVEVFCDSDVLKIVKIDESKVWDVSSSGLVDRYTDHFVNVSHWSNDGTYVYVQVNPHTDGYWEPFHQGIVLYRLTLETGQVSEVLSLVRSNWRYYSFAFSPNDRRLAYIVTDQSPVILNIRDMQTGIEQSLEFDPKYNTGGGFIWSPDGQKLVFSVTQFDTANYEYIATSIILWDQETDKLTELIKDHKSQMRAIEWIDETKIKLEATISDTESITTQNYEFDLATRTLTEIDP